MLKEEVDMDEPLSNYHEKEKVGFLLLVGILRLEKLACLEEELICLYFIVFVILIIFQQISWRNRCRKREIRT